LDVATDEYFEAALVIRNTRGYLGRVRIFLGTVVWLALLCGSATAATPIAPADGTVFAGGSTATFVIPKPSYGVIAIGDGTFTIRFSHSPDAHSRDWIDKSLGRTIDSGAATTGFDYENVVQPGQQPNMTITVTLDSRLEKGTWYWTACPDIGPCSHRDTSGEWSPLGRIVLSSQASPGPMLKTARHDIALKVRERFHGAAGIEAKGCKQIALVKVHCRASWRTKRLAYKGAATITRNFASTEVVLASRRSMRRK
jgi:hypothetical protein